MLDWYYHCSLIQSIMWFRFDLYFINIGFDSQCHTVLFMMGVVITQKSKQSIVYDDSVDYCHSMQITLPQHEVIDDVESANNVHLMPWIELSQSHSNSYYLQMHRNDKKIRHYY